MPDKTAARPAPSAPAEYGLLGVLLLPIGLWWLARAGGKKAAEPKRRDR